MPPKRNLWSLLKILNKERVLSPCRELVRLASIKKIGVVGIMFMRNHNVLLHEVLE